MANTSDTSVIAKFFGKLPGQTLKDVLPEIKALTDKDKAELAGGINDGTYTY